MAPTTNMLTPQTLRGFRTTEYRKNLGIGLFQKLDALKNSLINRCLSVPASAWRISVQSRATHAATPQRLVFVTCQSCKRNMDTYHEPRPLFSQQVIRVRHSKIACSKCAE
jgi:hypothetical protein